MKRSLAARAATVALVGGTLVAGASGQAAAFEQAPSKCVSQAEYRSVKPGMTKAKVKTIFQRQVPTHTDDRNRSWYFPCQDWTFLFPTVKWTAAGKVKSKALKPGGSVSKTAHSGSSRLVFTA